MKPDSDKPIRSSPGHHALGFGYQVVGGMVLFTGLGWYLDRRRGGGSILTLIGMFLGLLYMAYETWKLIRNLNPPPSKPES